MQNDDVTITVTLASGETKAFECAHHFSVREDGLLCINSSEYGDVACFVSGAWAAVEMITPSRGGVSANTSSLQNELLKQYSGLVNQAQKWPPYGNKPGTEG